MRDIKRRLIQLILTFFGWFGLRISRKSRDEMSQIAATLDHMGTTVLFDIGANVGKFARSVKTAGFRGKVVCFEPLPDAHAQLLANTASFPDVVVHERVALGDEAGSTTINVAGNSVSSSLLKMLPSHSDVSPESSYVSAVETEVRRLDQVFDAYASANDVVFLKIDTQGYETHVLDGAGAYLDRVDGLLLELSLVPLYEGQSLWKDIVDRLYEAGFTLWRVTPGFTNYQSGQTLQFDGLFIRSRAAQTPSDRSSVSSVAETLA